MIGTPYFCIRYIEGRHVTGYTTDGIDFFAIPRGAFGSPREAIRYAEMRQLGVSPLRGESEVGLAPVPPALPPAVSPLLDGRPSGIRQ